MLHLAGIAPAAVEGENDWDRFRSVVRPGHVDKVCSLSLSNDESASVFAGSEWGVGMCHRYN
jgi:hypothetical protein